MNDRSSWQKPAESVLDPFMAAAARALLEQRYYARVQQQAELARVLADPTFLQRPSDHVALFADHGIAHVRDVAARTLQVLDTVHGVFIARRPPERLARMRSLGVMLAYVHDIGMAEPGRQARAMHPEYSVQAALSPAFDDIIAALMADDRAGVLPQLPGVPQRTLREVLATAMAHSKSKVPALMLSDRAALREALIMSARCELGWLYDRQRAGPPIGSDDIAPSPVTATWLATAYAAFEREGFEWLTSSDPASAELADDVIDTLRVLRAADALRQRGTTLKTSGNNEIFVDQRNASAIFALRLDSKRLFLLEIADPTSAGEANLSSSELDHSGHLRISFHHGRFKDETTNTFAARCAAMIVADIHSDALGSFARPATATADPLAETLARAEIHLEAVDDNPEFADLVREALRERDPGAAARVRIVPSLQASTPAERVRYLAGAPADWEDDFRRALLNDVARYGHRTDGIDPDRAFDHVRQIALLPGETLVEAETTAGFVYIPLNEGLRGQPLGGYTAFDVAAWTPVGVTGVVRGAARNATIVAREPVQLIAIPRDVYLAHWHRTYDVAAFAALFGDVTADAS